ncbi:MAG: STAS domain-containing protein [Taibaiella sp.]|nr:STAS domain-containing protein [Taibaiella sp.]
MILNHQEEPNGLVQATIVPNEANADNAELFKEELTALVDNGAKNIILSFKNVTYIDSSFLGSLVVGLKYAMPRKADIYLVDLEEDIHDLFRLIRMDRVFKIYKNYNEAVKAIQ